MFKKFFHGFILLAFLAGLLAVTPATPAYAATLTVNTLVDENDSSCVDGDCSLRDALEVAASGDTIQFSVTGTIALTGQLEINKAITIDGPGSALLTVDGNGVDRVFLVDGGAINVSISGLTISGGYTVSNGAGIDSQAGLLVLDDVIITGNSTDGLYSKGGGINAASGSLTITNSVISFNHSELGSGIYCSDCDLSITNTTISNNDDLDNNQDYTYGGGLYVYGTTNATLNGVTISNNTAGAAGGVYFFDSTFVVLDSDIYGNTSDEEGAGGIYINNSSGTITDSSIVANTGDYQGGMSLYSAVFSITVDLNNVTIAGNQAMNPSGVGGGLWVDTLVTANINNVTIANNASVELGGGLYSSGTVNISNSIIADNSSTNTSSDDCYGSVNSLDHNLIEVFDGSCSLTGTTTHNITGQDPSFPPALEEMNGTHVLPLNPNSPAIDAGDDATCETTDQRGQSRPIGPSCDMGAYEFTADNAVVNTTNDSGGGSLRFALEHLPATGGTIAFSPLLSGQTITLASRIDIASDASINGASLAEYITISGNDTNQIFGVNPGVDFSVSSVNLVHGLAPGGLAGPDLGGAIYNYGNVSVYYVNFSNNVAKGLGGAIFNNSGATLYVANSTFTSNSAADANNLTLNGGGAITNYGGDVEIHTSTFSGNSSDGNGGALYLDGGVQRLYTSTFNNNTSNGSFGGAIYTANSALDVQNSTFVSNSVTGAGGIGGGIYNDTTTFVRNSTFSGNSAPGGGGAVASDDALEVYNSILANSTGGVEDCWNDGGTVDKNVNNLIETGNSCGPAYETSDPNLGALADNGGPTWTMEPQYGSPVINAGDAGTCLAEDQRAQPRPSETACEIGAFEVPDSVPPVVVSILRVNTEVTALTSVQYTVTFSEDVNGVDGTDFSLLQSGVSGATVTSVTGSNSVYTVTVNTGSGNGVLRMDLADDNSVTDDNAIPLGGVGVGDGDAVGQPYIVSKTTPVQLVPTDGANVPNLRPSFDWTDFPGAIGYQIQVSKTAAFNSFAVNATLTGASNSQYTPTKDLTANTLYYWRVRHKITAIQYGPWSAVFTFTTGNPPSIPSLLSPGNNFLLTDTTPTLDWSDSTVPAGTTLAHYQVQIDDSADFSSPVLDTISAISTYTTVGFLDQNTKYYWRVRAWNTDGDYSGWSSVRNFREAMRAPLLITPTLGITVFNLKPTFDWSDVAGATGYTIQVSLSNTFNSFAFNVTLKTATSQYVHSMNLQASKTYFWRVRANGPNGPSVWSTVESFQTP